MHNFVEWIGYILCVFDCIESNLLQLQIKWKPSNLNTIYSVKINYRGPKVGILHSRSRTWRRKKLYEDISHCILLYLKSQNFSPISKWSNFPGRNFLDYPFPILILTCSRSIYMNTQDTRAYTLGIIQISSWTSGLTNIAPYDYTITNDLCYLHMQTHAVLSKSQLSIEKGPHFSGV